MAFEPINWSIIKNPLNWAIVVLMLMLAAVGGHILLSYFGVEPSTDAPSTPTTSQPQS